MSRSQKEKLIKSVFFIFSLISVIILGLIVFSLFREGLPIFKKTSVYDFIFGMEWYPTADPPLFGIFPLIVGSVVVTFFATLIAVPLGVLSAVYISEIAPRAIKEILKSSIELLAGLPSVVLGFFEDALYAVPREFKEASYALGATKLETIIQVVLPAALSGILTAIILGMSRAIGETMVVLMVAGGAAALPESIFDSVRPMPASIAAEMGEAPYRSLHYQALFATGIVLFLMTIIFNLIAEHVSHKFRQTASGSL